MFTPDPFLSTPATTRWKKSLLKSPDSRFSISDNKNLRRLINSRDASKFLSISATPGLNGPKVSRNEDAREVSLQLVTLKKKHDVNKSLNLRNQVHLNQESKFIEKFRKIEERVQELNEKTLQNMQKLEKKCEEVKKLQEEALEMRKVYKHMLNRMRTSKLFIDEQCLKLGLQLKEGDLLLGSEENLTRKLKETKIQTKAAHFSLEAYVEAQTLERSEQLQVIKKDAALQQKTTENRGNRVRRQAEIAEAAADEERNNRAVQIRESLILNRVFYFMLDVKLQSSKKRFALIDQAFQKVKNHYGYLEPVEMIEKILTKEQTYTELLTSINSNSEKITKMNGKILEIQEKIDFASSHKPLSEVNKQCKAKYAFILRESANDKQKLRKIKIIHDKIKAWAARVLQDLGYPALQRKKTLKEHLAAVKDSILAILKKDFNLIRKSKALVDGLKVEQVLMFVARGEKRRRTFSNLPFEEMEMIRDELVFNEEDASSQKKLV
jgi:hypothetical protein